MFSLALSSIVQGFKYVKSTFDRLFFPQHTQKSKDFDVLFGPVILAEDVPDASW